ncbi:hypothetical protein [Streptomyces alkaliterrae]|uniref:Uncharacterized protein n=1 Tax=Streptomyces alkaliterrae TaxID=2213162 RepID=A0A5P0YK19_9ACTN|nr:hypothetical protein [Streptomyces alkaliterrae]MBB1258302.1 hypothetical protein [Streptomyces alkaliterrae]MQS00713.1 hypothetical protein [Streptomyces alkaliterrae]
MQTLIIAREPEPRHDRPQDLPSPLPPLPQRNPGRTLQNLVRAGLYEDMERDDDQRGYEDEPEAFYRLIKHLVADGDQRAAAAGRRAPRTRAEREERLLAACGGAR